jgi:T-complex protein 1 subunit zeta
MAVCRTSLRTKLPEDVADHLTEIVTSAVMTIHKEGESPDLHMVEIMAMKHKTALDSQYVDGLVLDHGARHPDMAKRNENAYLLVANVSLEYEKTEINSGFFYKNADERQKMATAERKFTDERVNKIIDLKKKVCVGDRKDYSFIVINQKGIDPISLDMLQKHNIVGIRRCKRRNMERLSKACGGSAINSLEDMDDTCLGFAKCVYEHQLGEEVFTFVEGCKNPTSCTILLKGPNEHTINQLKDAVHDGLRAVFNAIEDQSLVPGAGAFELAAHEDLQAFKITVPGRAKLGVEAFANAMLCIPKTLAQNAGYDAQTVIVDVLDQMRAQKDSKVVVGVDLDTGKAMDPRLKGIWDNYRVKKQFLHLGSLIAIKLLLVDEVMRAGRKMGKG